MTEMPIGPFYRKGEMRKMAMSLDDIGQRIGWIKTNVEPMAKRIETLNVELQAWWKAYQTWNKTLSDDIFIEKVLAPLQQTYGTRPYSAGSEQESAKEIYSIEELEAKTGRSRR